MTTYTIPVSLGERSYHITIESGLIASGRAAGILAELAGKSRVCLVTHPGLRDAYAAPIEEGLRACGVPVETALIPAGERYKTLRSMERLYTAFLAAKLDRKGLVVAVGGGVLGDMAGFAAATYLRGVRFVQVPTTLLSQVDASVGGKTGVDLPQGKNLVGAFHQPSAVLIDPQTLQTLSARELRSGLAEVIKYGIIYDAPFFDSIVKQTPALLRREEGALSAIIARSCEIKAEVVAQDETEQGLRAILNYGHTIGHALETVTNYRRYKHGEAISIGMVVESRLGERMGITPPKATAETINALNAAHLPVAFPADLSAEAILEAAQRDKKTLAGQLRFILARRIGEVEINGHVTERLVREAIAAS